MNITHYCNSVYNLKFFLRVTRRGKERIYLLIHSHLARPSQAKARIQEFSESLRWVAGNQILGSCSTVFPSHQQRPLLEMEQLGHERAPVWDVGISGSSFSCFATTLIPNVCNFITPGYYCFGYFCLFIDFLISNISVF